MEESHPFGVVRIAASTQFHMVPVGGEMTHVGEQESRELERSETSCMKYFMQTLSTRGVSIGTKRSSEYSL